MSINQGIQKIAGTYGLDNVYMLTCEVSKVDVLDRSCMCVPVNGNMTDFKAYLMAETDDGILMLPTEGSTVKVLFSNQNAPTVIQYSQIDKLLVISGNQSYTITDGSQVFNDGSFGGIPIVKDPANPNAGLLKKINDLENDLNTLKSDYVPLLTIVTALNTVLSGLGGAPVPASALAPFFTGFISAFQTYSTTVLTPTIEGDISNPNITHGATES